MNSKYLTKKKLCVWHIYGGDVFIIQMIICYDKFEWVITSSSVYSVCWYFYSNNTTTSSARGQRQLTERKPTKKVGAQNKDDRVNGFHRKDQKMFNNV